MLDDRVRPGEHQAHMTVVETHQVGRLSARPADLDDLSRPLRLAHDVATHVEPVPDGCLHSAHLLTQVPALPMRRRTRSRSAHVATPSIHLDSEVWTGCAGTTRQAADIRAFRHPGGHA